MAEPFSEELKRQMRDFVEEFGSYQKEIYGSRDAAVEFAKVMKDVTEKNEKNFKGLASSGRLTSEGFKKLNDEIDKSIEKNNELGKSLKKSINIQQKVAKASEEFAEGIRVSLNDFTRRIPLIGKSISKGFDTLWEKGNISKKITKKFETIATQAAMSFSKARGSGGGLLEGLMAGLSGGVSGLSAIVKSLGAIKVAALAAGAALTLGIGAAIAGIAAGISIAIKAFRSFDKAVVDITKSTGLSKENARELAQFSQEGAKNLAKFGFSLEDIAGGAAALANEFGNTNRLTQDMLETTLHLSKQLGVDSQTAAKTVSLFTRTLGVSGDQVSKNIDKFRKQAYIAGVSTNVVMQELTRNSSLFAENLVGSGENMINLIAHSKLAGSSIEGMTGSAEKFMNIEEAIENTARLNALSHSRLDPILMNQLAMSGDFLGMRKLIVDAAIEAGIVEKDNLYLQRQFAQAAGMSVEELKNEVNQRKEINNLSEEERIARRHAAAEEAKKMQELQAVTDDFNTTWEKITNRLRSTLLPAFTRIGRVLEERILPRVDQWLKSFDDQKIGLAIDKWAKRFENFLDIVEKVAGFIFDDKGFEGGRKGNQYRLNQGKEESGWFKWIFGPPAPNKKGRTRVNTLQSRNDTSFATGGLVTKPTRAIIGEAGPELILPLKGDDVGPQFRNGRMEFANGGGVIPLSQLGQLGKIAQESHRGRSVAMDDPSVQRRMMQESRRDSEEYKAFMKSKYDEYYRDQREFDDRRRSNTRRFGSFIGMFREGVSSFDTILSGWGTSMDDLGSKLLQGLGFSKEQSDRIVESLGGVYTFATDAIDVVGTVNDIFKGDGTFWQKADQGISLYLENEDFQTKVDSIATTLWSGGTAAFDWLGGQYTKHFGDNIQPSLDEQASISSRFITGATDIETRFNTNLFENLTGFNTNFGSQVDELNGFNTDFGLKVDGLDGFNTAFGLKVDGLNSFNTDLTENIAEYDSVTSKFGKSINEFDITSGIFSENLSNSVADIKTWKPSSAPVDNVKEPNFFDKFTKWLGGSEGKAAISGVVASTGMMAALTARGWDAKNAAISSAGVGASTMAAGLKKPDGSFGGGATALAGVGSGLTTFGAGMQAGHGVKRSAVAGIGSGLTTAGAMMGPTPWGAGLMAAGTLMQLGSMAMGTDESNREQRKDLINRIQKAIVVKGDIGSISNKAREEVIEASGGIEKFAARRGMSYARTAQAISQAFGLQMNEAMLLMSYIGGSGRGKGSGKGIDAQRRAYFNQRLIGPHAVSEEDRGKIPNFAANIEQELTNTNTSNVNEKIEGEVMKMRQQKARAIALATGEAYQAPETIDQLAITDQERYAVAGLADVQNQSSGGSGGLDDTRIVSAIGQLGWLLQGMYDRPVKIQIGSEIYSGVMNRSEERAQGTAS